MKTRKPFAGFTAALVAVCMMLQLIPAFGAMPTAQALEVGESFVVNFFDNETYVSGDFLKPAGATMEKHGWVLDAKNTTVNSEKFPNIFDGITAPCTANNQTLALKFKAPEKGVYKVKVTATNSWKSSKKANVTIDGKLIGTACLGTYDNSVAALESELGQISIKNDECSIAFTITDFGGDVSQMQIKSMTLTKVGDLVTGPVINFDDLTTDTLMVKKITEDSPWELDSGKTTATNLTVYSGTLAGGTIPVSYLASTHSNQSLEGGRWNFQTLSFRIKIEEDGLYDLSAITYLVGSEWNRADQIQIRIDGVKVHEGTLSSVVKEGDTAKTLRTYTLNQVALKKGYHNIAIIDGHGSRDNYSVTLNSLIFNRVGDITSVTPAVVSDNFGENYAYIRKSYVDGTTVYNVIFLGGIDAITDYVKVGFEYSTDGGANWIPAMSNKVYESLEFSDGDLANTDFGTDYIFYSDVEFTGVSASSAVTFRACAEAADGSKIYGAEYTVPVNK